MKSPIDRSNLEAYAVCPRQAVAAESGYTVVANRFVDSGEAVHQAIAAGVRYYCDGEYAPKSADIVEEMTRELHLARPDIQPDAIEAARASMWSICRLLREIHPANILHHDGGEGARCGQLSFQLGAATLTCEADLVFTNKRTPDILEVIDWKTGWGQWSVTDVVESFQFQWYALAVLRNYPDVVQVNVSVWNTRTNNRTTRAVFTRADIPEIEARINSALVQRVMSHGKDWRDVVAWPDPIKCGQCELVALCGSAPIHLTTFAADPEAWLDDTVRLQAVVEERQAVMEAYVSRTGKDLVSGSNCFGFGRIKRKQKPKAELYSLKGVE